MDLLQRLVVVFLGLGRVAIVTTTIVTMHMSVVPVPVVDIVVDVVVLLDLTTVVHQCVPVLVE